jgi:hypothetical protein
LLQPVGGLGFSGRIRVTGGRFDLPSGRAFITQVKWSPFTCMITALFTGSPEPGVKRKSPVTPV